MGIRYFCPCREFDEREVPIFLSNKQCMWPLDALYMCEVCLALRCPLCIDKEPVSLFCPNCLFEVTSATATRLGNICPRNCTVCPECCANNIVHAGEEESVHLECSLCDWKSHGFDKSKPIHQQAKAASGVDALYDELRACLDSTLSSNSSPREMRHTATNLQSLESKIARSPALRARYTKLCRGCRSVLVKPVPQPGSMECETMILASFRVPKVSYRSNALLLQNPLATPVKVDIAARGATLQATHIELGPALPSKNPESLLIQTPSSFVSRETTQSRAVFMTKEVRTLTGYTSRANWALVPVESGPGARFLMTIRFAENVEMGVWFMLDGS